MSEENKAVVQRFADEVLNQRKIDAVDDLFAPGFVDHQPPMPGVPGDREGLKTALGVLFGTFTDLHLHLEDLIAEGDKVVARYSAHGTHNGDAMGIPPTGKEVTFDAIAVYRIQGGKITDRWELVDMLKLMQQIGAAPAPG